MALRIKIPGFSFNSGLPVLSTGGISFQRAEFLFFSICRWARSQKQQTSITVYRLTSVFCIYDSIYIYIYTHIYSIYILLFQMEIEAQAIFLNPFTVCLHANWSLSFVRFLRRNTNGSYPFANGLNGLNGLAHLWFLGGCCFVSDSGC